MKKQIVQETFVVMEAEGKSVNPRGDKDKQKKEKKDQGVESLVNLENKVTKLEIHVGEILEWKDTVSEAIGALSDASDGFKDAIGVMKEEVLELINVLRRDFKEETARVQVETTRVHEELARVNEKVAAQEQELNLCKAAIAGGAIGKMTPHTDAPKPLKYGGKRDPKELEEFFWSMECDFKAAQVKDDKAKVDTAVLYLSENAALWWRRKYGDIERGLCTMDTWEEFKRQLKRQFCPHNAEDVAMKKLRGLKHSGNIKEYVVEFTSLMLELPDMQEKDKLFYFLDGLQSWAYNELKRRNVRDIDEAIAAAEDLMDFRKEAPSKKFSGGEQPTNEEKPRQEAAQPLTPKGKGVEDRKFIRDRREMKCYLCDGPHWIKDCPKKKTFSAMMLEAEDEDKEEKQAHMSSIRYVNSVTKKGGRNETRGRSLMFVEAKVNGRITKALVDTGATHSFLAEDEAKKLGVRYTKESGWLKVVNSPSIEILGVAYEVPMKIADWDGTHELIVVPMDDYRMVLGMDFFDKVSPWSFEKDNTMRITRGSRIHIVPLERSNTKSRALATMKFIEGPKKMVFGEQSRKKEDKAREVVTRGGQARKDERPTKVARVFQEGRWRPKTKETKQGTPYPSRHREVAANTLKKKNDYGEPVTRKYTGRNLDEDVKGLSGGECHGRSFWTPPGLPRRSWNVQEYRRRPWRGLRHEERPWNIVEYSRSPWKNIERIRGSRMTLEYYRNSRVNVERPRRPRKAWECPGTRWKVLEFSRTSKRNLENHRRLRNSMEGSRRFWKAKEV